MRQETNTKIRPPGDIQHGGAMIDQDMAGAQDTIYLCNFRVSVDGEWLCLKELQDVEFSMQDSMQRSPSPPLAISGIEKTHHRHNDSCLRLNQQRQLRSQSDLKNELCDILSPPQIHHFSLCLYLFSYLLLVLALVWCCFFIFSFFIIFILILCDFFESNHCLGCQKFLRSKVKVQC